MQYNIMLPATPFSAGILVLRNYSQLLILKQSTMANSNPEVTQLLEKVEVLMKKQNKVSKELNSLRVEVHRLRMTRPQQTASETVTPQSKPASVIAMQNRAENVTDRYEYRPLYLGQEPPVRREQRTGRPLFLRADLEKYIGENLINKIGIIILIIGVSIGAKYAIDHQLISPLTRIILGYLVGVILLIFAIRLKKQYDNFSAVLLSGSMAIIYFITYLAYIFYGLIPQLPAFVLMVIFTTFTVMSAISYNKQVIAHIGLVGAYAVPFLLSEGPANMVVLFSYTAIINIGILVISFIKDWKSLYYSAFGLTWIMYLVWYEANYQVNEHFGSALIFAAIFFVIFYVTFLSYKLFQHKIFEQADIVLLLANSFLFYGIGYGLLNKHSTGEQFLGLFTFCNAIVHFIVSLVIYRQKLADRNLFYMVSGLVLVFLTIAIPVQLNGSWVTLVWVGEAAVLFWIGRTKNAPVYEKISYVLMILAFLSIMHDWLMLSFNFGDIKTSITPIFNIYFLSSIFFIAAFGFINFLNRRVNYPQAVKSFAGLSTMIHFFIPAILIITVYYTFRMEITLYWDQLYSSSLHIVYSDDQEVTARYWNTDLRNLKAVWVINYALFFVTALAVVNLWKFRNQQLGLLNFGLIILMLFAFLSQGLFVLSELRESYLTQDLADFYTRSNFNLWVRYISYVFVAVALIAAYKYSRQDYMKHLSGMIFDFLLHLSILWIASSELISLMDIAGSTHSYKLGLSILWGIYSLVMIVLGIFRHKKYLRVGAIALFGVTLIKLFSYDISHLDNISKTIVFVSLGVLLLIISFLYNKYKGIISGEGGHIAAQ
jgi:uncharacterized membrane protein